ncbi:MAG: DUF3333 domain-containing protein, partial [Paracoccaceae bacterium]|nr:DUF3333 domain-containing protein [Paracoccaceae bacterium]
MTDASHLHTPGRKTSLFAPDARTNARNAAEARFRLYGLTAVIIGVLALVVLLSSVLGSGLGAFRQTFIEIEVALDPARLDPAGNRDVEAMKKVTTIGYGKQIETALVAALAANGVDTAGINDKEIFGMLSKEAPATLRNQVLADPGLIGQTIAFK